MKSSNSTKPPTSSKPVIALDRDGVINVDSPDYIKSPDEWVPIPGSLAAIARLHQAGYPIYIITNQSGVGRGLFTQDTLHAIHQKMLRTVAVQHGHIEHIFYCPHTPSDHCPCRKPKPGLLQQLVDRTACLATDIIVVGDSFKDLQAAHAIGCQRWILVKTGNGEHTLQSHADDPILKQATVYADLAAVAAALCIED